LFSCNNLSFDLEEFFRFVNNTKQSSFDIHIVLRRTEKTPLALNLIVIVKKVLR
jgi:hypothetical protein